jgi:predicted transcriptional regulator
MSEPPARETWTGERTTFQRVYDVLVGTREFLSVAAFAERADCSETAARGALDQLTEMGIARRRDGRPATYRRNDSYFEWKRVESLAREHTPAHLRDRVGELVEREAAFRERFGVPDPDAVTSDDLPDDHGALEDRWDDLREWRTVRRDVRLLREAVQRADRLADDGASA